MLTGVYLTVFDASVSGQSQICLLSLWDAHLRVIPTCTPWVAGDFESRVHVDLAVRVFSLLFIALDAQYQNALHGYLDAESVATMQLIIHTL